MNCRQFRPGEKQHRQRGDNSTTTVPRSGCASSNTASTRITPIGFKSRAGYFAPHQPAPDSSRGSRTATAKTVNSAGWVRRPQRNPARRAELPTGKHDKQHIDRRNQHRRAVFLPEGHGQRSVTHRQTKCEEDIERITFWQTKRIVRRALPAARRCVTMTKPIAASRRSAIAACGRHMIRLSASFTSARSHHQPLSAANS